MSHYSDIGPTTFLGSLLRSPLRLIPKGAVVRVRSGLNGGMRWIVGSSDHGCWLGHYERSKQDVVRRLVKPGMKVLDIGANAGFYTLAFARLVGDSGHVWAFEPFAENVQNLRRHVALNGLRNVTLVQAAVSAKSGLAGFGVAAGNATGSLSDRSDFLVPTVSVDEVCASVHLDCPDVIKLDVEGAEASVLEGASRTLLLGRSVVVLATHGRSQEQRCVEILHAHQYTLVYLDGTPVQPGAFARDEVVALPRGRRLPP